MGKNMSKARLKVYFTRFSGFSITECEALRVCVQTTINAFVALTVEFLASTQLYAAFQAEDCDTLRGGEGGWVFLLLHNHRLELFL